MRRLVHVISTPSGLGGAEQVMLSVVEEGVRLGWEQLVLNPFSSSGDGSAIAELSPVPVLHQPATSTFQLPGLRSWVRKELSSFGPQIINAWLFHAEVMVASLPRLGNEVRILSHQHGDRMRSEGRRVQAVLDKWAGRRYDRIISCSNAVTEFLVATYGYPRTRIDSVRNGWRGEPLPRKHSAGHTLVCVASLREKKGHRELFAALRHLKGEFPDVTLILLGEGPLRLELEELARSHRIIENVQFVGAVGDIWPHLASADCFVLASRSEPLGIAALEAMAAGLPVVATHVGGLPEVVDDGSTGMLVPPRDTRALAEAISRVLRDPILGRELGERGRERAAAMHMSITTERYYEIYTELLER